MAAVAAALAAAAAVHALSSRQLLGNSAVYEGVMLCCAVIGEHSLSVPMCDHVTSGKSVAVCAVKQANTCAHLSPHLARTLQVSLQCLC